ncbi:MAG TPA: hypothetical protein PKA10_00995 [Selenomonadales bacterium]|nr:hypothetical protein [Selenomonadales bacterium]
MKKIVFPDGKMLALTHAVFDYNGTLAVDGRLTDAVKQRLADLAKELSVLVVTADTFGAAREELSDVPSVGLHIIAPGNEAAQKADLVRAIGSDQTVCIGNGANDAEMFRLAALAIGVVGREGAYFRSLSQVDVVTTGPVDAIELLLRPKRLIATLRS